MDALNSFSLRIGAITIRLISWATRSRSDTTALSRLRWKIPIAMACW